MKVVGRFDIDSAIFLSVVPVRFVPKVASVPIRLIQARKTILGLLACFQQREERDFLFIVASREMGGVYFNQSA
jgi:hypothetical protein